MKTVLPAPTYERLPWLLRAYADNCIRSDWSSGTDQDREWGAALALCIDKFAKDWVAANCPGRSVNRK